MLTCKKCNKEKTGDCFNNSKTRKTGKRSYCKDCERNDARKFYAQNPENYKKRAKDFNKLTAKFYQEELNRLKSLVGCAYCEEQEPIVLDFHHFDRSEGNHTRVRVNMGHQGLQNELKKCIVLCANCHRKIHANLISL